MNKSDIRKEILKKRVSLDSSVICRRVLSVLDGMKNRKNLGIYMSIKGEVAVETIIPELTQMGFSLSLPKIFGKNMEFYKYSQGDELQKNNLGVLEPVLYNIIVPDIILVPLVAFDANLNRIGYGAGFYDRYINSVANKAYLIGVGYSLQQVDFIEADSWDIKLNLVITESRVFGNM